MNTSPLELLKKEVLINRVFFLAVASFSLLWPQRQRNLHYQCLKNYHVLGFLMHIATVDDKPLRY